MFTSRHSSLALARGATTITVLCLLLAACGPLGGLGGGSTTPTAVPTRATPQTPSATPNNATANTCPQQLASFQHCQTPHSMRVAYGIESLIEHGFTGKGQTVVDIVSFGSPTLQQDMDAYDQQFGLPPIKIQVISPLNEKEADPYGDKAGWGVETTLDVEIIHALAPDAGIVVLTSPVAETEGTFGLPEFRKLVKYTIDHHLGNIISNSWGASEATLNDHTGQQELQKWDTLLQQATTRQGMTFFAASGDQGASDFTDMRSTKLAPNPTTAFLADNPWVTSVGGTSLLSKGPNPQEVAWSNSGGGFSAFYAIPSYQQILPASVRGLFKNHRGVPDVAADGDPSTALANYVHGRWTMIGGTSASTPVWAAVGAIANQLAGHPLGFINPGLYKVGTSNIYTQTFHDITAGDNSISDGSVNVKGYKAVAGWDAVTGFGSPNAAVLLPALILALKQ
jgi:subtilase family serine protease